MILRMLGTIERFSIGTIDCDIFNPVSCFLLLAVLFVSCDFCSCPVDLGHEKKEHLLLINVLPAVDV